MVTAVGDAREIARIAYGFKASKALFTAIDLGIFARLSDDPRALSTLAADMNLPANRLEALLTALTGLGLLSKSTGGYTNAPGANDYLVPGKPNYFGDYFRFQTDRFIYPAFDDLASLIRGDGGSEVWGEYEELMGDAGRAETFSHAQHAGSLGGWSKMTIAESTHRLTAIFLALGARGWISDHPPGPGRRPGQTGRLLVAGAPSRRRRRQRRVHDHVVQTQPRAARHDP